MSINDPIYTTPAFSLQDVISMFSALQSVLVMLEENHILTNQYIAYSVNQIFERYPLLSDWLNKTGAFEGEEDE